MLTRVLLPRLEAAAASRALRTRIGARSADDVTAQAAREARLRRRFRRERIGGERAADAAEEQARNQGRFVVHDRSVTASCCRFLR